MEVSNGRVDSGNLPVRLSKVSVVPCLTLPSSKCLEVAHPRNVLIGMAIPQTSQQMYLFHVGIKESTCHKNEMKKVFSIKVILFFKHYLVPDGEVKTIITFPLG